MKVQKSTQHAHVEWIELYNDQVLHECAILKTNGDGAKLFFPINHLDDIDKKRLASILADRNSRSLELWDLMQQKTLGNGINALVYFHQFVKQLTPNGKIIDTRSGQVGAVVPGTVNTNPDANK